MDATADVMVQQVRRETFLAGEAECAVCRAWVRKPDLQAVPSTQPRPEENAVAVMCGVCGTTRYFHLT